MDSNVFYAEARQRLVQATDNPAVLESFDRLTERAREGDNNMTDAALAGFLMKAGSIKLSLDYIFCGEGEPFRA